MLILLAVSSILMGCKNVENNAKGNPDSSKSQTESDKLEDSGNNDVDSDKGNGSGTTVETIQMTEEKTETAESEKSSDTQDEAAENAIVPTITAAETKALMEKESSLIIIDLREWDAYELGHIKGAVQIELADLQGLIAQGLKDKKVPIVIYSESRLESQEALNLLVDLEFTNVFSLGSINDWEYDLVVGAE